MTQDFIFFFPLFSSHAFLFEYLCSLYDVYLENT